MSKYEEVETMASNFHIKFRKSRGNLHFRPKGKKGFDIAPNGSRVLISPPESHNMGKKLYRRRPCFDREKKRKIC